MERLSEIIEADNIALDIEAEDLPGCLRAVVQRLVSRGTLTPEEGEALSQALRQREELGTTCIGKGVVVPHAYPEGLQRQLVVFARLRDAVDHGAPDDQPVDLVFLLSGPAEAQSLHLPMLARMVRLLHDQQLLADLRAATTADQALAAIREVEARHA